MSGEQASFIKSSELARPPPRTSNPNNPPASTLSSSSSPTTGLPKGLQSGGARPSQGNQSANTADQQPPPDYHVLYELFTSSVAALISFHLVRDCGVIALNYRTFVSKTLPQQSATGSELSIQPVQHWLTSINVHWTGSGTLLVSTYTERNSTIRSLADIAPAAEQTQLVGTCIRVAPNGLLARVASFDNSLSPPAEDMAPRHKKRARNGSLEQTIDTWKSAVTLWLARRGYSLPELDHPSSWVRIRTPQVSQPAASSPASLRVDRDLLWPKALCFTYIDEHNEILIKDPSSTSMLGTSSDILKWFETPDSAGYMDPFDVAHEWFLGKPNRDKILDAKRRSQKSEEDGAQRKDEPAVLFPSSPLNARSGAYGDLQAVSGVYPTPPDGIAPGASHGDLPNVSGATSHIVPALGGTGPVIHVSGHPSIATMDGLHPSTSPIFPAASDTFNLSSGNDDLFEDIEEDGFGGDGVNDADFDFFDGPDDDDLDMMDTSTLSDSKAVLNKDSLEPEPTMNLASQIKEETTDPLPTLKIISSASSKPTNMHVDDAVSNNKQFVAKAGTPTLYYENPLPAEEDSQLQMKASPPGGNTPPLSPTLIAKTLQRSRFRNPGDTKDQSGVADHQRDSAFDPISFSRKMSISDAKYQDVRPSALHGGGSTDPTPSGFGPSRIKSLRDLPLLTKLRYAISVASAKRIPEISSLTCAVSDDSDSESDSSDASARRSSADMSTEPKMYIGSLVLPAKRKLPADDNGTPLSVTSFAESLTADWQEHHELHLDEGHLVSFEPTSWDWSLVDFPAPTERPLAGARFTIPALSLSLATDARHAYFSI